ncbi:MAG TPA: hypothetical protein VFP80_12875 [Thermoanaerobaculia bacterium]|nr:hypothetical protein [Thermoanaerobaculia bacterium]
MIKRKRALVAGFMMLFALVAGAGEAGQAKDPTPNAARWKVTQQVINETPYRMRMLSTTLTELTEWERRPAKEIEPNGGRDVHSFYNDAPGHGLVGHAVYGAYDAKTNAFVGMVIARSGIDCNARTDVACLAFHRWEGVACDSNGTVKGRWYDNAGDPENFWTEIHFVTSGGACNGFTAPAAQAEGPGPNPGVWWRVTGNFVNASPFRLKLRNVWNSEATHFGDLRDTIFPPLQIQPGQSKERAWRYANEEKLHGPSAILMYDAFDPDAGNKYVGSITFAAAVDCGPKWATGLGCLESTPKWNDSTAAAIPGYDLQVVAEPGGTPPHEFEVRYQIAGRKRP